MRKREAPVVPEPAKEPNGAQKRERSANRPYPTVPLKDALKVAKAISDNNAGKPYNRVLLADAMGYSASSSSFRELIMASARFGLTKGSYAAESIEMSNLGLRIVRPTSDGERLEAMREAMRAIPLFQQLTDHFKNNKLPQPEFFKNSLERDPFNVSPVWSQEAVSVFNETGKYVGVIRETRGGWYVLPDAGPSAASDDFESDSVVDGEVREVAAPPTAVVDRPLARSTLPVETEPLSSAQQVDPPRQTQFFVAHGRDRESLTQLKDMLTKLTIPFVIAQDEPHAGRPISQKVADLMRACSGGIFIFTGDEKLQDLDGEAVLRPRLNVVFELGAASLLYAQKIVIFKEKGVEFPTDFRDLGYIEFEKGQLAAKSMDLMMELIKLKALKLVPAAN
jgi:predicted nucleotide-binding protein